jgi:hypothetical protein
MSTARERRTAVDQPSSPLAERERLHASRPASSRPPTWRLPVTGGPSDPRRRRHSEPAPGRYFRSANGPSGGYGGSSSRRPRMAARGCRAVRPETPQGSARPRRWRPTCWPFRLGERPSLWTGRAVTMVASRATGAGPSGQPGPGRHGADMSSRGTDLEKDDLGSGRVWKRCRGVSTSSAEMAGHDTFPGTPARYTSRYTAPAGRVLWPWCT